MRPSVSTVVAGLLVVLFAMIVIAARPLDETRGDVDSAVAADARAGPSTVPTFATARDTSSSVATADERRTSPLVLQAMAHDLRATFDRLRTSAAGNDLSVARSILLNCYGIADQNSLLHRIAAGQRLGPDRPLPQPRQIEAATDLVARCHGFDGMTKSERNQVYADLVDRLDRADDAAARADAAQRQRRPMTDALLRDIVASRDLVALDAVALEFARRWRVAHGLPTNGDDDGEEVWKDAGLIVTLVGCNLADLCSRDSFRMREICAFDASRCDIDERTLELADVPPDHRDDVLRQVDVFVRAIEDQDFSVWGL